MHVCGCAGDTRHDGARVSRRLLCLAIIASPVVYLIFLSSGVGQTWTSRLSILSREHRERVLDASCDQAVPCVPLGDALVLCNVLVDVRLRFYHPECHQYWGDGWRRLVPHSSALGAIFVLCFSWLHSLPAFRGVLSIEVASSFQLWTFARAAAYAGK